MYPIMSEQFQFTTANIVSSIGGFPHINSNNQLFFIVVTNEKWGGGVFFEVFDAYFRLSKSEPNKGIRNRGQGNQPSLLDFF